MYFGFERYDISCIKMTTVYLIYLSMIYQYDYKVKGKGQEIDEMKLWICGVKMQDVTLYFKGIFNRKENRFPVVVIA